LLSRSSLLLNNSGKGVWVILLGLCRWGWFGAYTYFNYIKIYHNDCSRELLTNNADWIDHFYKNALYDTVEAIDIEHLLPKGYFLWAEMDKASPVYLQGRDFFNIDHGISFVIKRADVTYLYIFGANRENHEINHFYAGNIDLLQRFIHFFTDQAQEILKAAEENKIYLPSPQKINAKRVNNIVLSYCQIWCTASGGLPV
jgi:hypothetical protein